MELRSRVGSHCARVVLGLFVAGCDSDSLHIDAGPEAPPSGGEFSSIAGQTVRFGVAGDFGGLDEFAGTVMTDMTTRELSAFFLLGDTSYDELSPERTWCNWVHDYLGPSYPLQVVAGNHEEDSRSDGHILTFAQCMPDRLGSQLGPGGYGVNFASDLGPLTFIATSPDLEIAGVSYTYAPGSSERDWLIAAIEAAQQDGDWVVVGMHKNCVTIGNKTCEIGPELAQLLIGLGVNVVVQGHDHDYQRSHALATIVEGGVGAIADSGTDGHYVRGAGTVFVIAGTAGRGMTDCSHEDPEYGNFAAHWCGEEATDTKGYVVLSANGSVLSGEFIATTGTDFDDVFSISAPSE